jgi:hypothetical protein
VDKVLKTMIVVAVVAAVCGARAYGNCGTCDKGDAAKTVQAKDGGDRFKAMDTDNDGKISKAEFAAAGAKRAKDANREAPSQEATDKRFAAVDADKDGFLTKEEMAAAHKKHGEGHKRGEGKAPAEPK